MESAFPGGPVLMDGAPGWHLLKPQSVLGGAGPELGTPRGGGWPEWEGGSDGFAQQTCCFRGPVRILREQEARVPDPPGCITDSPGA